MQHTPTVRLPEEKHHRDWGVIIAAIAIVVLAVLTVIVLARPGIPVVESATNYYANPEVMQAENYLALQAAAEQFAGSTNPEVLLAENYMALESAAEQRPGPTNPELSASYRFRSQFEEEQFLRENPEVRRFLQSPED